MMVTLVCLVKLCSADLKCLSTRMELSHFACVLWVFILRLNIVSHLPTYGLKCHKMLLLVNRVSRGMLCAFSISIFRDVSS